jgi:hypothetical protein
MCLHRRYTLLNDIEEASKLTQRRREGYNKQKFTPLAKLDRLEKAKTEWVDAEAAEKDLREEHKSTQDQTIQELNACEPLRIEMLHQWITDFILRSLNFESRILKVLKDTHNNEKQPFTNDTHNNEKQSFSNE